MQFLSVASHFCAPAGSRSQRSRRSSGQARAPANPAFTLQTSPHDLALAFG